MCHLEKQYQARIKMPKFLFTATLKLDYFSPPFTSVSQLVPRYSLPPVTVLYIHFKFHIVIPRGTQAKTERLLDTNRQNKK